MFENERARVEETIHQICLQENLPQIQFQWNWIPFSGHWGVSTSLFALAAADARQKQIKVNISEVAARIAEKIAGILGIPAGFEKVEAVNGYLNLYFSQSEYSQQVLDTVIAAANNYGRLDNKNELVMVEFSQPNTHKAFHVGHLRSAILGDTLARILEFAGYEVIRSNYPGDMGLHVIKWLWCYMNFHPGQKPERDITHWMGEIYAEANNRLTENPDLEKEVRALYKHWDERDPEIVQLWEETREWSLQGFYQMYAVLGIRFDRYYFNSQMEIPGKAIVQELIDKKIALDERPDGAVIVKIDELLGLPKEKFRVFVVLRSDGTALYATEDLALAKKKFDDYPQLKRSLYVVDVRQSLHFQQVFKTMEIAGYPWADRCQHIAYELVNLPGNVVMSSREGAIVLLEDLIREAVQRAYQVVQQKNPDLAEEKKMETARAVGVAALKYPMLARENTKIVTFDWESALDFNGQAAPYIQYAYVRTGSILRKGGGEITASIKPEYELTAQETELIDVISRFPREVERSAAEFRPIQIANYAYDLARKFNDFYAQCPVLQVEEPVRNARLRLVMATRQTIENSLALLGITAPEAM
jgi:arginyl-tRNA synthetase